MALEIESSNCPDSEWRTIQVRWNEPSSILCPYGISPWKLEPQQQGQWNSVLVDYISILVVTKGQLYIIYSSRKMLMQIKKIIKQKSVIGSVVLFFWKLKGCCAIKTNISKIWISLYNFLSSFFFKINIYKLDLVHPGTIPL